MRLFSLIFIFLSLFSTLYAQGPATDVMQQLLQAGNGSQELTAPEGELGAGYPDLTTQAAILIFLAISPFLVMLLTSFLKMVISLALLRSALGVQQTPPNQLINGIALILTLYVMYPTGVEMYQKSKHIFEQQLPNRLFSADSAAVAIAVIEVAKEPLREFLIRNSKKDHIRGFYRIAQKTFPKEAKDTLKETDLIIVIPAFITTQIRAAFEIGVLIYLPFFVIDLVTSNILLAMQMMMLSPLSISLPLKLLLVVMIDGWTILVQGLVLSFN
ncbi:MAG: type III secretion system export apparatus subunit SctR [Chlamydiales bacterium]